MAGRGGQCLISWHVLTHITFDISDSFLLSWWIHNSDTKWMPKFGDVEAPRFGWFQANKTKSWLVSAGCHQATKTKQWLVSAGCYPLWLTVNHCLWTHQGYWAFYWLPYLPFLIIGSWLGLTLIHPIYDYYSPSLTAYSPPIHHSQPISPMMDHYWTLSAVGAHELSIN